MRRSHVLASVVAWGRRAVLVLALPFAISVAAMRANSAVPASQEQQIVTMDLLDDSLARFSKLMPVFMHDRCVNCHGDVNPFTGDNHEGGALDAAEAAPLLGPDGNQILRPNFSNGPCTKSGCHSASHARFWALAPKEMRFSGHTADSLCRQIQQTPRFNKALLLKKHFHEDELIMAAFIGERGFPDRSPEPPGMSAAEFVLAADRWLDGSEDIPCSGWVGTITQTETVDLTTHYSGPGPIEEHTTDVQQATRSTVITLDGRVTLRIVVQGTEGIENSVVTRQDGQSCTTTGKAVTAFHTTGDSITSDARSAKVMFLPGGKYELAIKGPVELTSGVERSTLVNCVLGELPTDSTPKEFEHSGWIIGISGVRSDPSDPTHLQGNTTETRTLDNAWLTQKGGVLRASQTRDNGELLPVPVEVKTTWDLRRR